MSIISTLDSVWIQDIVYYCKEFILVILKYKIVYAFYLTLCLYDLCKQRTQSLNLRYKSGEKLTMSLPLHLNATNTTLAPCRDPIQVYIQNLIILPSSLFLEKNKKN